SMPMTLRKHEERSSEEMIWQAASVSFSTKRKAMLKAIIGGTVVMLSFPIGAANAQGEPKYQWEAGFQVTTIQFGAPAEKPLGLGGRIGRELGNHITVEAEANHFPENPSGNFGETQAVGGIKTGVTSVRGAASSKSVRDCCILVVVTFAPAIQ